MDYSINGQGAYIMAYGDKRDFRKIDLYEQIGKSDGYVYKASTTWAATSRAAKEHYLAMHPNLKPEQVHAMFA